MVQRQAAFMTRPMLRRLGLESKQIPSPPPDFGL
jgi:hypothetical protein